MKSPPKQPDLFGRAAPTPKPTAAATPVRMILVEAFNDWDETRMVPDPAWVIPAELRLPTDDLGWMPNF